MMRRALHWSRGLALHSVSGEIVIDEMASGAEAVLEVEHGDEPTRENTDLRARFADYPLPRFGVSDYGGYAYSASDYVRILPLLDGLTGTAFRVLIVCLEPIDASSGPVILHWERKGVLSDES